MGIDRPTNHEEVENQSELLRKQTEAIEIAERLGPNYEKLRKGDDRCSKALEFIRSNEGKILTFDEVSPVIATLDASNRLTAHANDGIMAVEAALHSLHNPEMGYNLAKRAEKEATQSEEE